MYIRVKYEKLSRSMIIRNRIGFNFKTMNHDLTEI